MTAFDISLCQKKCVLCRLEIITIQLIKDMAKYIGALILLIGAVLLIVDGVTANSSNTLLGSGLALVVIGYIAHIIISRKTA